MIRLALIALAAAVVAGSCKVNLTPEGVKQTYDASRDQDRRDPPHPLLWAGFFRRQPAQNRRLSASRWAARTAGGAIGSYSPGSSRRPRAPSRASTIRIR